MATKQKYIEYHPVTPQWQKFVGKQGFKTAQDAFDCCWISMYNISLVVFGLLGGIFALIADMLICLCITLYNVLYGFVYSIIRCVTAGQGAELKRFFIIIILKDCNAICNGHDDDDDDEKELQVSNVTDNGKEDEALSSPDPSTPESASPPPFGEQKEELPQGWKRKWTAEGRVYYQNSITKTTQWDKPTSPIPV